MLVTASIMRSVNSLLVTASIMRSANSLLVTASIMRSANSLLVTAAVQAFQAFQEVQLKIKFALVPGKTTKYL